ncbi:MAG: aminodeoxychorismate lyase [Gammaproteobacteria bacterium]
MSGLLTDFHTGPPTLVDGLVNAQIDCANRGLAYGDGLFETLPLDNGAPRRWSLHYARMRDGAARLFMPCPAPETWLEDITRVHHLGGGPPLAVLKLLLVRAAGSRGYAPPTEAGAIRIVQLFRFPQARETGRVFVAITCATPLGLNPRLAGVKHLNRLEQVLGAREVALADADEGVMCDVDGQPVSGTRANLFIVRDGVVLTPPVVRAGIAGVMRARLLAHRGTVRVQEAALSGDDLRHCDEMFFTNVLRGMESVDVLRLPEGERRLTRPVSARLCAELAIEGVLP